MTGASLPAPVVDAIQTRTEGWVTGLRLAALSLLDEVLHLQPPAVQHFLLNTSILERFCAPLCAVLVDGETVSEEAGCAARSMLDHVTTAGPFVTLLDEAGEW